MLRFPLQGETTKVCVQPLSLSPLPTEGDRPHRVSRFAGRLRDWSKCKLPHPKGRVNSWRRFLFVMQGALGYAILAAYPRTYPQQFHDPFSFFLHVCCLVHESFVECSFCGVFDGKLAIC